MHPRPRLLRPLAAALLAAGLALGGPGCGEPPSGAHSAQPTGPLPVWEGHQREVFDDNLDPAAVGLSMDAPSPRTDPFLRERSQTGDIVARFKVQTVTLDSMGDSEHYHLGLLVGRPTLVEPRMPDSSIELAIRTGAPAFAVVKSFDARLRGKTFIGFVRKFQGADGEPELHWHLSADTEAVAASVKEAVALRELSGS